MRALLALLAVAVFGSGAFALSELHSLHHVASAASTEPAVAQVPTAEARAALAQPAPVEHSTWRGPLPFGGVPGATAPAPEPSNDVDSDDVIIDESDRCPDDGERSDRDDGCPEPEPEREMNRRVITIEMESLVF